MASIPVQSEEHWHALRAQHVGASEVAALFGLSPWTTAWQLHMIKAGKLPAPDLSDSDAVRTGKHFEPAIAAFAAEKYGISLRKVRRYLTDDTTPGMGASLDYEQIGTGALIPTEIKWSVFGHGWDYEGDSITQAPEHYILQVQQEIACAGASEAQLFAFVNGDVRRMVIPRREPIIQAIREEIAEFWNRMRRGEEPPIDFTLDADAIGVLAALNPMCSVDLSGDAEAETLAATYLAARDEEKNASDRKTAAQAALTKKLLDLAAAKGATVDEQKVVASTGGYRISASMVAGNAGTVVTPEMVGTVIGGRRGYRRVTISRVKEKVS